MMEETVNVEPKLLFANRKEDRKTNLEIYSTGTVKFSGPCSNYGLNVPLKLKEWMEFPKEKTIKKTVICNFLIINEDSTQDCFTNIKSVIHYKYNKWLIQPAHPEDKKRIIDYITRNKWILQCDLNISSGTKAQPQTKNLFHQAKSTATVDLSNINNLTPIISYEYRTKKASIYQDAQGIVYLKVVGKLSDYGAFHISSYVGQYLSDWFTKEEELYYASLGGQEPIVVPASLSRRKARGGRINKKLIFPYWGEEKEVEVIFSSPNITLTPEGIKIKKTREFMLEAGIPVKGLLTNVWNTEKHIEKEFAKIVQAILQSYDDKNPIIHYLPETVLGYRAEHHKISDKKHCFDHFCVNLSSPEFEINIGETISSITTKGKNRVIDEEIALLHSFQEVLGENCLAILFINGEVTSRLCHKITNYYSLAANVLILGKDRIKQCQLEPNYFKQLIKSFQAKQTKLQSPTQVIHPKTTEICHQQELFHEALILLLSIIVKPKLSIEAPDVTDYCKLMGIGKSDFLLLSKEGQIHENRILVKNWLAKQPHSIISPELFQTITQENQLLDYLYIHYRLLSEQSVVFLGLKPELDPLYQYKELIKQKLPNDIKLCRTIKTINDGSAFERSIAILLEDESYLTLCNIVFSFAQREFEIDILALTTNELLFVSCKDHKDITNKAQAEKFLRIAANRLAFHCSLCNIQSGRLYLKANPKYSDELIKLYHKTYWTEQVQLFVLD